MSENVYALVDAIKSGDVIGMEQAFSVAMAEKIASKIDDMKLNMAQTMFNKSINAESVEDQDLEEIVENYTDEFDDDEIEFHQEELDLYQEKYEGFKKLSGELAARGAKNPGGLAAWIGRRKYGEKKFQAAAAKHQKMD